jgi:2-hydroxychromene-2-carboxylate isomerase
VYGDFTCPYSFLASQRVDALVAAGLAAVQWRAVERDRSVASSGRPGPTSPRCRRAETDVAALARPGERIPARAPVAVGDTRAALYAYAWAGVSDRPLVRRRLFEALWIDGLPVGSVADLLALLARESVRPALSGSAGSRLVQWRAQWQQVSGRRLPVVVRPADGVVVAGADALAYLAGLLSAGPLGARLLGAGPLRGVSANRTSSDVSSS